MSVDLSKYSNRNPNKVKRLVWEIVWAVFFRTTPRWCLNGWRRFLLRMFGASLGKGLLVRSGAKVWQPWRLKTGDNSWIDNNVSLYSVDDIRIGSNVVISDGAFICTASHDISSPTFNLITKPIEICDGAWICAKAIVLPGVKIGEGAVVAAGSVVAKDVDPWSVVAGNPARKISTRRIG